MEVTAGGGVMGDSYFTLVRAMFTLMRIRLSPYVRLARR